MKIRTKEYIIELIRQEIRGGKTQAQVARSFKVSAQHISDILSGRRNPGPKVLAILGLKKVVGDVPGEYFFLQDFKVRNKKKL